MAAQGTWEAAGRATEAYENGSFSGWNVLDVGLNALSMGLSGRAAFSEGRKLSNRIAANEVGQRGNPSAIIHFYVELDTRQKSYKTAA